MRIPRIQDRLLANAGALMLSSAVTGALGLVYWIVAGRLFDADYVGRASALISTATMLSSLSCLSLGGAYQRFLPLAGNRTRHLIGGGYLLSGTIATLVGACFAWLPVADRLLDTTLQRLCFPLMVLAFTLFALTDPILTGLRRAPAVAAKNIALSAAKLPPLLFVPAASATIGIIFSWTALLFVLAVLFCLLTLRWAPPSRGGAVHQLPPVRELLSFQGAFFAMMLVAIVTPLALPLIVINRMGTTENAYFNMAWTMCSAVGLLRGAAGAAFIVEASVPDADRAAVLRRYGRLLTAVTALTAAGLALGGPFVLWLAGPDYLAEGWRLMVVMAVAGIIETLVLQYFNVAQLLRRLRLMLVAQIVMVLSTLAFAAVLVGPFGLTGIGLAVLASSSLTLVIVAGPLIRGIREMLREQPVAEDPDPELAIALS